MSAGVQGATQARRFAPLQVAHLPGIGLARQCGETYDVYLEVLDQLG
ncbi:hypothetical protein [Streptomyces sp. NPDC086182]